MIKEVNENNFAEETKDGIVLVDVFTPPCGPCQQQIGVLKKCVNLVKIVKVNAHESTDLALKTLGVRSVPTLIWYKNGAEVKRTVGFQSDVQITKTVTDLNDTISMDVDLA